jgi:hypothetical protein
MKPISRLLPIVVMFMLIAVRANSQTFLYNYTADAGIPDDQEDSAASGPKINVKFDLNALSGNTNNTLTILLPDFSATHGRPIVIVKEKQESSPGRFAWIGKVMNQPSSFVLISQVKEAFAGQIRTADNKFYCIEFKGKGIHRVSIINQDFFKPDIVLRAAAYSGNPIITDHVRKTASMCCDSNVIDVLVLYTRVAKRAARSDGGIDVLIDHCENLTNISFEKSKIPARINVVAKIPVTYQESGSMQADRTALMGVSQGPLQNVFSLRDQYGADIVVLIVENSGSQSNNGVSAVMENISPLFESQAFCVVRRDAAYRDLVFPHEIGHILGARHHCGMDWEPTPFPYSHGYISQNYATIMAKTMGKLQVEYWSDTALYMEGTTEMLGSATATDAQNCMAMDAICLRQTIPVVAKFRCHTICSEVKTTHLINGIALSLETIKIQKENNEGDKKNNLPWRILGSVAVIGTVFWFIVARKKKKENS